MSAITTKFVTDHKLTNEMSLEELNQHWSNEEVSVKYHHPMINRYGNDCIPIGDRSMIDKPDVSPMFGRNSYISVTHQIINIIGLSVCTSVSRYFNDSRQDIGI